MARVRASLASQSSRSPKSTSERSPSDTSVEKPTPRPRAQSSIEVASAPDCEMKASVPGVASTCEKLALSRACGASSPRQLGPTMRSRCTRAASSIACFCAGVRPAVITTAARVPSAPRSAISPGSVAGGVQMTASSGACGRSCTRATTGMPSSSVAFGFTAISRPA
ncbi:hypothetical protein MASR1M6_31460 [Rubrivivax sp.]